jgi:hypothetical protein
MTDINACFSTTYADARAKFRAACEDAGLAVDSWRHPLPGMQGEALATDAAWIGPTDARRVLLATSGTHGVEGFYGSGCQVGWLRRGHARDLPAGCAVLLVHATNPYGFSWLRRVNEDNIDINRNFLDFEHRLPDNPGYFEVAHLLAPESWGEAAERKVQAELAAWTRKVGRAQAAHALSAGQHTHPNGLFYGGTAPCWSNRTVATIAAHYLEATTHFCVLDFHTGLGPPGYSEIICRHPPGSLSLERARRWFGTAVTSPAAGESDSPVIEGNLRMAFARLLPDAEVVAAAIEVGTQSPDEVTGALIGDNWLHLHGDPASPVGRAIQARIRRAFYPDTDEWRAACFPRAMEIMDQAVAGLAAA